MALKAIRKKICRLKTNTASINNDSKRKIGNSPLVLGLMTAGVLAAGIFAGRKMFKNFVAADSEVRKYVNNETAEIEKRIKALSDKIQRCRNKRGCSS